MSKDEVNVIALAWFLRLAGLVYISGILYYVGRAAWLFKKRDRKWVDAGAAVVMLVAIVVAIWCTWSYLMLPDHALPR